MDKLRCPRCKDEDHEHCLFDPPYKYCDCSKCFEKAEPFSLEMEINMIAGSD